MGVLSKLVHVIRKKRKRIRKRKSEAEQAADSLPSQKQFRPVSSSLEDNLTFITQLLGAGSDLITAQFEISGDQVQAGIVYVRGLADKNYIDLHIIERLKNGPVKLEKSGCRKNILEFISSGILSTVELKKTNREEQVIAAVLAGDTALFVEDTPTAFLISTAKFEKRGIEKPETEISVWSSKEGFIEDLATNIALLRRWLPTPDLRFESFVLGKISQTEVRLAWIEGIANPKIIEEARRRIKRIDVDFVYGSGLIAELIEDKPTSIWPQVHLTEHPDKVAANLVEGRFAILCNMVPFVIIAPVLFWQNLQTTDDYTSKAIVGTFYRLLRHLAFYLSLMATPLYVALVSYHQSIIPPPLALRIAAGREGVPFPSLIETLFLSLVLDLLREAGVRLPQAVGGAVTFLGAVVIGQAAVTAGFVSPAVIIVVSVTAIANFAIPAQELVGATRIGNYFLIFCAAILGVFGITLGMVWLLFGVISLRSFGIPLFYPVAPGELYGLKDIFVRSPAWRLRQRPSLLAPANQTRMSESTMEPKPKKRGGDEHR